MTLLAVVASLTCLATPIEPVDHQPAVCSGAITGYISPSYDVVRGRFSLHVGPWRMKGSLTQKIPWYVRPDAGPGPTIAMTAVRLAPLPAKSFRQTFRTGGSGYPQGVVYPSIIDPPSTGCWRLTMRTGRVAASFIVLVRR